ncbi:MAG: phosphate acetyltransferase [Planctomycetota bacterium]|nr:MAG: phosphate acetyltransferase [Planctomycetota bacterium]
MTTAHSILVTPTHGGVGTTSICLGLLRSLERAGIQAGFCKPIAEPNAAIPERSTALVRQTTAHNPPEPIRFGEAERLLSQGNDQVLLERVVALMAQVDRDCQVVIIEGVVPSQDYAYADKLNEAMARALDARVILVTAPDERGVRDNIAEHLAVTARGYGGPSSERILGAIVNQVPVPMPEEQAAADPVLGQPPMVEPASLQVAVRDLRQAIEREGLRPIAFIPAYPQLGWLRASDVARQLGADMYHVGDSASRRVKDIRIIARTVTNCVEAFAPGTLIITPGDREDIFLAVTVAALGGIRFAGILLTGGFQPSPAIMKLCRPVLASGLPIFFTDSNSFSTANRILSLDREVPVDDAERVEVVMNTVANHLDPQHIAGWLEQTCEHRLSPPAFRHNLIERARAAARRIVLPEGDEPRTLRAAAICHERGIARCVLLGNPEHIQEAAQRAGVQLPDDIDILDPALVAERYVGRLVELRKHKGMTEAIAVSELADTVMLGTMMLKLGEVDGLVSGAVHTTANTIRPALQLIKTAPNAALVSSVFFMCLPDQVVVYGDCAVNPEPTAEQLADIALQSAASARAFGIPPRVAMISYSTGSSGHGAEVERVRQATALAKERQPDLIIDGPLQYDAATIESVARSKAPDSPVAGRATVFIFPDLNTGNTTYKAVQRSASVVSIGPLLQGLAKPVNDLSRGALVEDIVYTIALTAIQAEQLSHQQAS